MLQTFARNVRIWYFLSIFQFLNGNLLIIIYIQASMCSEIGKYDRKPRGQCLKLITAASTDRYERPLNYVIHTIPLELDRGPVRVHQNEWVAFGSRNDTARCLFVSSPGNKILALRFKLSPKTCATINRNVPLPNQIQPPPSSPSERNPPPASRVGSFRSCEGWSLENVTKVAYKQTIS